jgi:tetratricopeptide (TPR) repeat protein
MRLFPMRLLGALALTLTLALAAPPAFALPGDGGGDGGGGGSSSSSSKPAGPTLKQAQADIDAERWQAAINKLKDIVADDNTNADAYNLLGYAYRHLGDYKRAGQYYGRALKLNPKHLGALEYQGEMFVLMGEIDKAKANLAKIKEIKGTDNEYYEDLNEAING